MKRIIWFCILFAAVVGTEFAAGAITKDRTAAAYKATARKLKGGYIRLDDYSPVDPTPSSKAVIPRPIQHGTPMIPYIPRPSPPRSNIYP